MMTLSGPMFEKALDEHRMSIFHKDGGHYNIFQALDGDRAMAFLRLYFPDAKADALNFVLFSTSGVHGSYSTIEAEAKTLKPPGTYDDEPMVTFVVVQPRLVSMTYGNVRLRTADDVEFLKKLRASSWEAVRQIGADAAGAGAER